VPYELVETTDHYYIVLELPGISSIKQVRVGCIVTDTGYEVSISGTKPSAVDVTEGSKETPNNTEHAVSKCTRHLGEQSWHGVVYGVFESQPECNYREGIFKMRLKKRSKRDESVHYLDF